MGHHLIVGIEARIVDVRRIGLHDGSVTSDRDPAAIDLAGVVEVPPASETRHPDVRRPPERPGRLLVLLGLMAALGPASMDLYLPALPTIARELGVSASVTQLTVGAFLVGLGAGQLVAGPMSDVLGRRRPLLVSILVYVFATTLCAAAPGIEVLVVSRLLQGASAAAGVVIARAVVRDLYSGAEAARYLSRLVLIFGLAPVLAPIVGALMLSATSWRGLFVLLGVAAIGLLAAVAAWLPETLPPGQRRPGGVRATAGSLRVLIEDRAFVAYATALGLGTAAIIGYIAGAPFLLQEVHGLSPGVYGAVFGVNAIAMIVASQVNAQIVERVGTGRMLAVGVVLLVASGAMLTTVEVAGLGIVPTALAYLLTMTAWGLIPPNAIALGMAAHPEIAGAASAMLGVFQYGLGGLAAPLAGLGATTSGLASGLLILVCGLLAAAASATGQRWAASRRVVAG